MPCFKPVTMWTCGTHHVSKKRLLRPYPPKSDSPYADFQPVVVNCNVCEGCLERRKSGFATRSLLESTLHQHNCVLTLTYDEAHLPMAGNGPFSTLRPDHLKAFMKRLRREFPNIPILQMACGEYGGLNQRAHYHVILNGIDFKDKQFYKTSRRGSPQYISETLSRLWPFGLATVGIFSFEAARYTAGYILKKPRIGARKGTDEYAKRVRHHYGVPEFGTGELIVRHPEFASYSTRPAIALNWIKRFVNDVYPKDSLHVDGRQYPVPEYFDSYLDRTDPEMLKAVKERRAQLAKNDPDRTPERLAVRHEIFKKKLKGMLERE